ncbi:uncharacterized protein LOC135368908 [Ornithodoros turicata]|uniref:uncharacterized protein LOC135368908 n=1 Tax=Ornithodoros turicata TaxID=34597 RepID=UPI0031397BA0
MILKDGRSVSEAGALAAVLRYPDPDLVETDASTAEPVSTPGTTSSWDETYNAHSAAQVQSVVDAVDHFLYEDGDHSSLDAAGDLLEECRFWKTQFAHLRIVGRQVMPSATALGEGLSDDGSDAGKSGGKKYDSAEEEMVEKVVEKLCQLFWPEVEQWTKLSRDRSTSCPRRGMQTGPAALLSKHRPRMACSKLTSRTDSRSGTSSSSCQGKGSRLPPIGYANGQIRLDGLPLSIAPAPRTKKNGTASS